MRHGSLLVVALAGCSRKASRERTDRDVEAIITQKNVVPRWKVENWLAYPEPRAPFADPSCPDFPPDDYAASLLSPNPQKPDRLGYQSIVLSQMPSDDPAHPLPRLRRRSRRHLSPPGAAVAGENA